MGIVHVFVNESRHPSGTKLYIELGSIQEHKLRGNSEFVQYHTEIGVGTFWRDSECEYDWSYISVLDEISIVPWSSAPVDTSKSTCLLRLCTVFGEDVTSLRRNWKLGRSSGRILNVRLLWRVTGNRWRSNWIRVELFSQHLHHCRFFRRSRVIHRSGTVNLRNSQIASSSCPCSTILQGKKRKRWDLYFDFRKSQDVREEILAGTLEVPRSWRREEVAWKVQKNPEGKWNSVASQMTQRVKESSHQVFSSASALSRGMWAIRFDSGRESLEKGESVNKEKLKNVNSQKVNSLVSSRRPASGNRLREYIQDFEWLSETIEFTEACELASFWYQVSAGMSYKTKPGEDDGVGDHIPVCWEYTLPRANPLSRAYAAIPGVTIIGPVIEVHVVQLCGSHGLEIEIPFSN